MFLQVCRAVSDPLRWFDSAFYLANCIKCISPCPLSCWLLFHIQNSWLLPATGNFCDFLNCRKFPAVDGNELNLCVLLVSCTLNCVHHSVPLNSIPRPDEREREDVELFRSAAWLMKYPSFTARCANVALSQVQWNPDLNESLYLLSSLF